MPKNPVVETQAELFDMIDRIVVPDGWTLGASLRRVSTDRQEVAQQRVILREGAGRHKVFLPEELECTDEWVSRSDEGRAGLARAKMLVQHPRVASLWIWEFERAIGDKAQKDELFHALGRAGGKPLYDAQGYQWNREGAHHEFTSDVLAAKSKMEVQQVRERVRETHEAKVLGGLKVVTKPLYGLCHSSAHQPRTRAKQSTYGKITNNGCTSVEDGWHNHTEEMPWLQRMFKWAAAGKSCVDIEKLLVDAGIRTKQGRPWSRQKIRSTLTNPFYAGQQVWGKKHTKRYGSIKDVQKVEPEKWARGVSPLGAIIDETLFATVQQVLAQSLKTRSTKKMEPHPYDKLMFCGYCFRRMYRRRHHQSPRVINPMFSYTCTGRNSSLYSKCPVGGTLALRKVEAAMVELVTLAEGVMEGKLVRMVMASDRDAEAETKRLREALKALGPQRVNARRALVTNRFSDAMYDETVAELDGQQAELEQQLKDLAATAAPETDRLREGREAVAMLLPKLSSPYIPIEEKQLGLSAVLSRMLVRAGKVIVEFRQGDFLAPLQP